MLGQNTHDLRLVDLAVAAECRQEQLLLRPEVAHPLAFEEVDEDLARSTALSCWARLSRKAANSP